MGTTPVVLRDNLSDVYAVRDTTTTSAEGFQLSELYFRNNLKPSLDPHNIPFSFLSL